MGGNGGKWEVTAVGDLTVFGRGKMTKRKKKRSESVTASCLSSRGSDGGGFLPEKAVGAEGGEGGGRLEMVGAWATRRGEEEDDEEEKKATGGHWSWWRSSRSSGGISVVATRPTMVMMK
ncbi:hypothetical protein HAX54_037730, partial [Datura stramonium]|nr:hypothetical protein [Datura stramonium]